MHEISYQGLNPFSVFHRTRMRRILKTMRTISLPAGGGGVSIADFGCSNGFFFAELLRASPEYGSMKLFGFDHSTELLAAARLRNFDNAVFEYVDLNEPPRAPKRRFDVVTCFETLEHVGQVRNAIDTLLASCKAGGTLLISVPNETGLPGLLKYVARKIFRGRPYDGFFRDRSEARYIWHLISGQSISVFRDRVVDHWGAHLGFDWRTVLNHLHESKSCRVLREESLVFGRILVVRRT